MMELAFEELDAPVGRLHTDPTAHPSSPRLLEEVLITKEKIVAAAKEVMAGRAPAIRRAKGSVGPAPSAALLVPAKPVAADVVGAPAKRTAVPLAVKGVVLSMPHGDLTVTEATVAKWYKKVGEPVAKGEGVVDVETEKAVSVVESPVDGTLAQILEPEGSVVTMGQQLAIITPK
jgi:2-oxoisovalerate dehydrogenase E1 component